MVTDPAETPVTIPPAVTVATAVELLVHTPPEVPSISVVVEPAQTDVAPVIVPPEAVRLTVTDFVVVAEPQALVTV